MSNPNPGNGFIVDDCNVVLSWVSGTGEVNHDVYLGTDFDELEIATPFYGDINKTGLVDFNDLAIMAVQWLTEPVFGQYYANLNEDDIVNMLDFGIFAKDWHRETPYLGRCDSNEFVLAKPLAVDKTYFWRVDEVVGSNIYKGDVWSFWVSNSNGAAVNDPGSMCGGGNFTNGWTNDEQLRDFGILESLGAKMCRVNVYPGYYIKNGDWNTPNCDSLDDVMMLAHQHAVTPILLFEYYRSYYDNNEGFGNYQQWYNIGRSFAARYCPGGTWGQENGIEDFGITIYTAMNEPDGTGGFRVDSTPNAQDYANALEGLADGVHSVNSLFKVLPGGFSSPNAYNDWTLRGLGPVIATLFNQGKLAGLDLHTYYDVQWAPMENTYNDSAQKNFEFIKNACGITADIEFFSTEYNYKYREVTEEQASAGLLTGIWDNLGVVKNDGHAPATVFAMPWNIFALESSDHNYGLSLQQDPWIPTMRGKVLQMVLNITSGMQFVSLDPYGTGVYVLRGNGKKLWVWQNRNKWTNIYLNSFTLTDIPAGATNIFVYSWNGLMKIVPVNGQTEVEINDLQKEQTYMFLCQDMIN
ncbi:MAG: hypothetical protein ISS77_01025 [Phycisphaerae bacterium]|nr:hypothetical protein [Phycisphaerae bacterium]